MLSFAVVELHLSEEQFWRLTPTKFFALMRAKREQIKREDYRTGILAMIVRSALGAKNCQPFDFFPQHKDRSPAERRGITPASEVRANLKAYMEAVQKHGEENEKSG